MNEGDAVKVTRQEGSWLFKAIWWPESDVTGTVQKVFKNGNVRIACDQFRNNSEDGKLSKIFTKKDLVSITKL